MKPSCKLLPHLNQLYNQKKSYDFHKRKMKEIKYSQPKLSLQSDHYSQILKVQSGRYSNVRQKAKGPSSKRVIKTQHQTIQQNFDLPSFEPLKRWRSPLEKRKQQQRTKQNTRLRQRIKTSISNLNQRRLSSQYDKISSIRKRISKYEINPYSQKVILKCKKSLQNISHSNVKLPHNYSNNHLLTPTSKQSMMSRKKNNMSLIVKKNFYKKEDTIRARVLQRKRIPGNQRLGSITSLSRSANKIEEINKKTFEKNKHELSYFPTQVDEDLQELIQAN